MLSNLTDPAMNAESPRFGITKKAWWMGQPQRLRGCNAWESRTDQVGVVDLESSVTDPRQLGN